jgi:hypothetical protein
MGRKPKLKLQYKKNNFSINPNSSCGLIMPAEKEEKVIYI